MIKLEHNIETGKVEEVEMTSEEILALETMNAEIAAKKEEENAILEKELAEKLAEKEIIAAKIGLTVDEVITLLS